MGSQKELNAIVSSRKRKGGLPPLQAQHRFAYEKRQHFLEMWKCLEAGHVYWGGSRAWQQLLQPGGLDLDLGKEFF